MTGSPGSVAIRLSGKMTVAGATEPIFVDLVLQQESRGMVETAYFGILDPPSSPLESRLSRLLEKRLARYAA